MPHVTNLDQIQLDGSWISIGSFDGVHRAHQEILKGMVAGAHQAGLPAVVITFYPHPSVVLRGNQGHFYLTSPDQRAELISALGVDHVITLNFTKELAATPAQDFIGLLNQRLGLKELWVGYNFALGRGREGDIPTLQRLGDIFDYRLVVSPPIEIDGQVVSSSLVRSALSKGEVDQAAHMLGRLYDLSGTVIHGDGRGHLIGIPTANLDFWPERATPTIGIYATWAWVDGVRYSAVTSIGYRPTFEDRPLQPRTETLILDFDQNLYGRQLRIEFVEYLRDEEKFPSVEALISQIQMDIEQARGSLTHEL